MVVVALPTPEEDPDERIRALEQERRELLDRLDRKEREADAQRARADSFAAQLATERERIKSVIVDLENSEVALRVERRKTKAAEDKLKRMSEEERHPQLGQIREVFEYWRDQCRGGSKRVVLGEKRSTVIAARLKDGYTVDRLCQAIDGARDHAFVNDDGKRFDELELIMRNEVKVDDFIHRAMGSAAAAPPERPTPRPPSERQVQRRLDVQRLIDALVDHWGGVDACIPDHHHDQEIWPCPKCTPREQVGSLYPLTVFIAHGPLAECSSCGVTGDQLLQAIE
jgi:hypothetical protein